MLRTAHFALIALAVPGMAAAQADYGTVNLSARLGMFKIVKINLDTPAEGRLEMSFKGTVLVSDYRGKEIVVKGDIRKEFPDPKVLPRYPEGYRKALRLMKIAEKFNKPIITFIDTPGAFPGLEAEERGQGEAIARNLKEMFTLKVPVICIIIGEGASGGALGIAIGDRVLMLENSWYSVISPENCSTILWRSWDYKEQSAEVLKLTAKDMLEQKLIDGIVKEPLGGAHTDVKWMASEVKRVIKQHTSELLKLSPEERISQRIDKFCAMGVVQE